MSFRVKVLLAQAPLAVALLLIALVAIRSSTSLGAGAGAILTENYRSVLAAQRMSEAAEALDRAALLHLTGLGAIDAAMIEQQTRRFEAELAVEQRNFTEAGEPVLAAELTQRWQAYRDRLSALPGLDPAAARAAYVDELAPAFLAVRATATRILELNQDAMVRKSDRARAEAERTVSAMLLATAAALAIGFLVSSLLTTRLLGPLSALRAAADRIGSGDFGARVPVDGRDELAQLGATFNVMAERIDRYRRSSLGELLLAQQAAQSAVDSLPDAVLVFDAEGEVLIVNRAAEEVLGIGQAGSTRAALDRLEPPLRAVIDEARTHVLSGRGAYVPRLFEDAVRRAAAGDGDLYYLARATPVYGEQGSISGATVILQDVTRLHRFDQLKNDLVATVAHEFRTPLTSLHMAIHLCLEEVAGPLSDRQADLLQAAREDCERLQRIVDELLDLARLQGGRLQLRRRPAAVRDLVSSALDAQRAVAADRQVVLAAEVAAGLPEVVVDEDRLQLVFANLLTNAIRHSPPGAAVTTRALAGDGGVRVEVRDEGPGIDPARRDVIFEKFAQGPEAPGGAGLGLSIAREIVTAHGGSIGVDSEVGRGSTFWFTLPVDASA
ncbi:HAMP domain-containing protein [bacterium]|nr:HAMP domain-containing protein [bacterium]